MASENFQKILNDFLEFAQGEMKLEKLPKIDLIDDPEFSFDQKTFGQTDGKTSIIVQTKNRQPADILRSLAHELSHVANGHDDTSDGSQDENQANAQAGVVMRVFGQKNPEIFRMTAEGKDMASKVISEGPVKPAEGWEMTTYGINRLNFNGEPISFGESEPQPIETEMEKKAFMKPRWNPGSFGADSDFILKALKNDESDASRALKQKIKDVGADGELPLSQPELELLRSTLEKFMNTKSKAWPNMKFVKSFIENIGADQMKLSEMVIGEDIGKMKKSVEDMKHHVGKLDGEAKKEKEDHPWATIDQAKKIAADHDRLKEAKWEQDKPQGVFPSYYGLSRKPATSFPGYNAPADMCQTCGGHGMVLAGPEGQHGQCPDCRGIPSEQEYAKPYDANDPNAPTDPYLEEVRISEVFTFGGKKIEE